MRLFIEKTALSPEIDFNDDGNCKISGRSISSGIDDIYIVARKFIKKLIFKQTKIKLVLFFEYFNSTTTKYIHELLLEIDKSDCEADIIWQYYDVDDDLEETGQMFRDIYKNLNIKLRAIKL